MTTLQEAEQILNRLELFVHGLGKAILQELRVALAQQGEPVAWRHDCNALLANSLELWIDHCPHCGKPRTDAPAPVAQEPVAMLFGTLPVYDKPAPQPAQELTGCACRWDADDNRVATCVRHQGWLDVVSEWADRAKVAEAARQSAQPVAQYDKTEMNAFVTDLYQRKSTLGQHGFYETLFHVVHKAIERAHGIKEVK